MSPADNVPVSSTTRPDSVGTATSASAAKAQQIKSASRDALAALIEGGPVDRTYFAGAGEGLKSTFGAVEISFSLSTVKFAFSL
jgi:hypothetical protein